MTKATIKKIAKEAGIDLSLIEIKKSGGVYRIEDCDLPADLAKANIEYHSEHGEQLPEVEKRIRKYNREAKKLVKAIGGKSWGFQTGYGAFHYELGEMDYSTKLAFANID